VRGGSTRVVPGAPAVLLAAAVLACGCGVGTATVRIDGAERTVLTAASDVAEALSGPADGVDLTGRERCTTVTGAAGLRNRVRARWPAPAGIDVLEVAAEVLATRGFELLDPDIPATVLGQRDGMRITVAVAQGRVELDGITGCRPPERG
jgi:hypothetical protein